MGSTRFKQKGLRWFGCCTFTRQLLLSRTIIHYFCTALYSASSLSCAVRLQGSKSDNRQWNPAHTNTQAESAQHQFSTRHVALTGCCTQTAWCCDITTTLNLAQAARWTTDAPALWLVWEMSAPQMAEGFLFILYLFRRVRLRPVPVARSKTSHP